MPAPTQTEQPVGVPCEVYAWCAVIGQHRNHMGAEVNIEATWEAEPDDDRSLPVLAAHIAHYATDHRPTLTFNFGGEDAVVMASGDELRAETAKMRTHLTRLNDLADQYDAICAERPPTTAAIEVTRRWTITTTNGITVSGYRPPWDSKDPSETDVKPGDLLSVLSDVNFHSYYPGAPAEVTDGLADAEPASILSAQIDVSPFNTNPAKRVPTLAVEMIQGCDDWIEDLDPAGVRDLAEKLRRQAALLDQAADDLADFRADWAKNGGSQ